MSSLQQNQLAAKIASGGGTPFDIYLSDNTTGSFAGTYAGLGCTFLNSADPTTVMDEDYTRLITDGSDTANRVGVLSFAVALAAFKAATSSAPITLTSCEVGVYKFGLPGGPKTINIFTLKKAFDKTSVTWNQQVNGVTNWAAGGAEGSADYDSAILQGVGVDDSPVNQWCVYNNSNVLAVLQNICNATAGFAALKFKVTPDFSDVRFTSGFGTDGFLPYVRLVGSH